MSLPLVGLCRLETPLINKLMLEEYIVKLITREQQQLFIFDWQYIEDILCRPGGASVVTGRFLVQFFHSPAAAVILTLTVSILICAAVSGTILRTVRRRCLWAPVLGMIPALFALMSLSDSDLHFDACIALLTASTSAFIHTSRGYKSKAGTLLAGIAGTAVTWLLAGPAAVVFALTALITDMKRGGGIATLIYPGTVMALAAAAYLEAASSEFSHMLTPAFFYEVTSRMPVIHLTAWAMVPAATALATLIRNNTAAWTTSCAALTAAVITVANYSTRKEIRYESESNRMEILTAEEKWQELSDYSRRHLTNFKAANYLNLAQAQMGTLAENLFKTPKGGPSSLIHISGEHAADICLAHVLYAGGNMAGAQNIAFNALQARCGYNPTLLKMLTKIELMRGSYEVAEKYLNLLSKAPRYSKWAERYKTFLYNDSAVEADPELGRGRRSWPEEDGFANSGSPFDELQRVMNVNPEDRTAMEYALSYLLLAKDINSTCDFIARNSGKPSMLPLPTPAQEALVFFSEYYSHMDDEYLLRNGLSEEQVREFKARDIDWCRAHGLTQETIDRFERFKAADAKTHDGRNLNGFQDTFWYYLLYTKI